MHVESQILTILTLSRTWVTPWFQCQCVEHEALFVVAMCDKIQIRDRFSWHYSLSLKIQHLAPQRSVMLRADFCFYQGNRYCITAVTMVTPPEWTHRNTFYLWLVETDQIRKLEDASSSHTSVVGDWLNLAELYKSKISMCEEKVLFFIFQHEDLPIHGSQITDNGLHQEVTIPWGTAFLGYSQNKVFHFT